MSRLERILESNREYAEQWWSIHFEEIKEGKYPECRKIIEKWRQGEVSCKCAVRTDEYHGWECSVSEGACMFLVPDSKRCAEEYGEGPDAEVDEDGE